MINKAHTKPRRSLKAAVGLGAAVASLAFAGVASAAVTVVTPDQPMSGSCPTTATSSNLTTAIQNATASTNTLELQPGIYCPVTPGAVPISISHNLTITSDHSYQATGGLPNIQIQGFAATSATIFQINSGTTVTLEGFNINSSGQPNGNVFSNNGTLNAWGMTFDGNGGVPVSNNTLASSSKFTDSTISDDATDGFSNNGTATFINVSFVTNNGHALDIVPGSKTYAYNTLFANNESSCLGGTLTNSGSTNGDLTDDTGCGAEYSGVSNVDLYVAGNGTDTYGNDYTNGGPATTTDVGDPGDLGLKGNPAYCPTTDERFFVNPRSGSTISCDIGAVTDETDVSSGTPTGSGGAEQETTAPSCTATSTVPGTSQVVTLSDGGSGIGPQFDPDTDNPSNTAAGTYPPLTTPANDADGVPQVPGYVAGAAVSNLYANNTSVSFTPPMATPGPTPNPGPTLSGVLLTATKGATPGINNSLWSFTGINWAGVSKACY